MSSRRSFGRLGSHEMQWVRQLSEDEDGFIGVDHHWVRSLSALGRRDLVEAWVHVALVWVPRAQSVVGGEDGGFVTAFVTTRLLWLVGRRC